MLRLFRKIYNPDIDRRFIMAGIVGTITSINDFLSKTQVCLSVKPNQPQVQSICLDEDRQYSIPAFQREVRWDDNNLKMLLFDLSRGSTFRHLTVSLVPQPRHLRQ